MGDPYDYNLMPESWRIEQLEDRIKQLEAENERLKAAARQMLEAFEYCGSEHELRLRSARKMLKNGVAEDE